MIQETTSLDALHNLGFAVVEFAKAHPGAAGERALRMLYDKGPCSLCRTHVVRLLVEMKRFPEWMAQECRWDANPNTRAVAQGGL